MNSPEIKALTGVRGFAAVWVMLCHYSFHFKNTLSVPDVLVDLLAKGWVAVDLFFILSGFILAYNYPQGSTSAGGYWAFIRKRLARIYPLHFVVLMFVLSMWALFAFFGETYCRASVYEFVRQLLLIQTWWGHRSGFFSMSSWSLSAELLAYLLFPVLLAFTGIPRTLRQRLLLLAALMVGYLVLTIGVDNNPPFKSGALRAIPCFTMGLLLFRLYRCIPTVIAATLADTTTLLLPIMGVFLYVSGLPAWLYVPLFVVWIGTLTTPHSFTARWMAQPHMLFLGRISYSLYLIHGPVLGLLLLSVPSLLPGNQAMTTGWAAATLFAASIIVTIALSGLSQKYIEEKGRMLSLRLGSAPIRARARSCREGEGNMNEGQ